MDTETSVKDDFLQAMQEFYSNYVVETVNGSFQIFRSFTYGEMVISFLLTCILFVLIFKWFYEVVR